MLVLATGLLIWVILILAAITGHLDDLIVFAVSFIYHLGTLQFWTYTALIAGCGLFLYFKISSGEMSLADGFHDTSKDRGGFSLWPRWQLKDLEHHELKHEYKAKEFGANGYWFYTLNGAEFQRTNTSHLSGMQHAAISLAPGADCSSQDKANAKWYIQHYYPASEFNDRMAEAKRLAR